MKTFTAVVEKDSDTLKELLKKYKISYTEGKIIKERPLIYIITKKTFKVENKNNLPVMPLHELVAWCKKLYLDSILEQLDELYNLNLRVRYAEINTNIPK